MVLSAIGRYLFLAVLALLLGLALGFLTAGNHAGGRKGDTNAASPGAGAWNAGNPKGGVVSTAGGDSPVSARRPAEGGRRTDRGPNYASRENGAVAAGCHHSNFLIDGNATRFSWTTGFAYTDWSKKPTPAMLVTLRKPTKINTIRFLLWDLDDRYFRYKLEVSPSTNGDEWALLADCTGKDQQCRSWQVISFDGKVVSRIKVTGTYNSENNGFHVIELQAFDLPEALKHTSGGASMEF